MELIVIRKDSAGKRNATAEISGWLYFAN